MAYEIIWIYTNNKKHTTQANTFDMAMMKAKLFIADKRIIHLEIFKDGKSVQILKQGGFHNDNGRTT